MTTYKFPAIFETDEETLTITITFPDLPGAISQGDDLEDAMYMAGDVLVGFLLIMIEDGETIPEPSTTETIDLSEKAYIQMIEVELTE
ncbi:type II toxin-antitoxin system HicB family antitoxin [Sinobaca sp. H24]|uniref:type II toxin-antitoxin system HicB family antitoxin n=1 Tax=Sinobaca sp. H24 TaxID=2923376 RepID=UPI00207ACA50|nr:type II toxin-antitoxin system HicB family antitoxin [Sinobaca sp. H24]